jgi:TPR repeat protein
MRLIAIATALILPLATPASADFDSGLVAFMHGDYPTSVAEFNPAAERGDARAQTFLGTIYSLGLGVSQDTVQGYMWFNLAAAQGNETARKYRDRVARWMTPAQIAEARTRAQVWKSTR